MDENLKIGVYLEKHQRDNNKPYKNKDGLRMEKINMDYKRRT